MILSALISLGFAFSAQASTKRYLVTFKSENTFHEVSQSFKSGMVALSGSQTAQSLNQAALKVDLLDKVKMVVIEADSLGLQALENTSSIARIEEEQFFPAPTPIGTFSLKAPHSFSAPTQMEQPWGIGAVKADVAWSVTRGEGVKVAVIDTGLDQSHPALSGRFIKGASFMGGAQDDFKDEVGHGTHVAGTVLADGLNGGLVGVAPEATLYSAKVCGALGCSTVAIAQAVDWAVAEGVDVINMSLGGPFMTFGEKKAYDAAEAAGVMIVAASGNNGTGRVSYPAAYTTTLAVGALNPDLTKAPFSDWGPELDVVAPGVEVLSAVPMGSGRTSEVEVDFGSGLEVLKSTSFQGSASVKVNGMEMVFAGLGKAEDFNGLDLQGKVALISRGEITFADKAQNAVRAGADGIVIFNNEPGLLQGSLTSDGSELPIPVVMIEKEAGERARDLVKSGSSVTTSMGIVPSDYASFQGTSMASPHVAGVAALIKAANPNLTPAQIRTLLKESAVAITPNDNNEVGSGLVNAQEAVRRAQEMSFLGRVVGL